jgi:hypothetical protein
MAPTDDGSSPGCTRQSQKPAVHSAPTLQPHSSTQHDYTQNHWNTKLTKPCARPLDHVTHEKSAKKPAVTVGAGLFNLGRQPYNTISIPQIPPVQAMTRPVSPKHRALCVGAGLGYTRQDVLARRGHIRLTALAVRPAPTRGHLTWLVYNRRWRLLGSARVNPVE